MILAAAPDPSEHLYWLGSRAAGTAALVLASAAVLVGVLRAGGLAGSDVHGSARRLQLGIIHEVLGLAVIVTVLIHGLVLLGDNFAKVSFADIAVPFSSSYHQVSNGIGIVSGYVFMVLGLSYYVRDRIGDARWTAVHRLTLLAWVGSFVHTLGMGTDRDQAWFLAVIFLPAIAALVVLVMRLASGRGRAPSAQPTA
jgi:methionine sulfoxide reductase heme-binding subunit